MLKTGKFKGREHGDGEQSRWAGFTILEVLVSMAVLAFLMVLLFSMVQSSAAVWQRSSSKIQTFQEARAGYEALTRSLAQATLNTFWDYAYDATGTPTGYKRQSDLHLVSGLTETLLATTSPKRPTQGIFFQAPLGYSSDTNYRKLNRALNAAGVFLEFGTDASERPAFLSSTPVKEQWRYRLKGIWQPSEAMSLFSFTSGKPKWPEADTTATPPYAGGVGNEWFLPAVTGAVPQVRTIAENIIALILLPRLPEKEDYHGTALAPNYAYDSRRSYDYQGKSESGAVITSGNSKHQLPPLVEVIMVAISENSAARLASQNGQSPPDLGIGALFQDSSKLTEDLATLESTLVGKGLEYRIFSSSVAIEGAKWSNN